MATTSLTVLPGHFTIFAEGLSTGQHVFDPRPSFPDIISPIVAPAGAGSPESVYFGNPGDTYWDVTNNVLYVKDTGSWTSTGWAMAGGGGGGVGGYVLNGHGDPSGPPGGDAAHTGVYTDVDSGTFWQWNGSAWV